jgi:[1-hydroxy-2-(trimethylamino)ethyl]phosphonate dioxygenase
VSVADEIFEVFDTRGHEAYFGEAVSQLEHALQTARLAEQSGAGPSLVAAALLHDIGHLIHGLPETVADKGIDAKHEAAGEAWLALRFGPAVTDPVRLHVEAKRYLCHTDPQYFARLSPSSVQSLRLQGGPFGEAEARAFEANRFFGEAVRLRQWDDAAKIPGLAVPGLNHYREVLGAASHF